MIFFDHKETFEKALILFIFKDNWLFVPVLFCPWNYVFALDTPMSGTFY